MSLSLSFLCPSSTYLFLCQGPDALAFVKELEHAVELQRVDARVALVDSGTERERCTRDIIILSTICECSSHNLNIF